MVYTTTTYVFIHINPAATAPLLPMQMHTFSSFPLYPDVGKSFVSWGFTAVYHQTNTSLEWQCQKLHGNWGKDSSHFTFLKQMVTNIKQSEDCFQPRAPFHYSSIGIIYLYISHQLPLVPFQNSLSLVSPQSMLSTNSINNSSSFFLSKSDWIQRDPSFYIPPTAIMLLSFVCSFPLWWKNSPTHTVLFLSCNLLESITP